VRLVGWFLGPCAAAGGYASSTWRLQTEAGRAQPADRVSLLGDNLRLPNKAYGQSTGDKNAEDDDPCFL